MELKAYCDEREFYSLITQFALDGAASGIVMADYNALLPRVQKIRHTKKYTTAPFFITFEYVIATLATGEGSMYPKEEKMAFVFDQQKEFQGRAKELYDLAKRALAGCGHDG
jgi:hypothetical protein